MRWEYRVVTVEKFLADMRYIGSDRWELVAVYNDLVYFKRPLGIKMSQYELTEEMKEEFQKHNLAGRKVD